MIPTRFGCKPAAPPYAKLLMGNSWSHFHLTTMSSAQESYHWIFLARCFMNFAVALFWPIFTAKSAFRGLGTRFSVSGNSIMQVVCGTWMLIFVLAEIMLIEATMNVFFFISAPRNEEMLKQLQFLLQKQINGHLTGISTEILHFTQFSIHSKKVKVEVILNFLQVNVQLQQFTFKFLLLYPCKVVSNIVEIRSSASKWAWVLC